MPIKKIIMSEEMLKKIEQPSEPMLVVGIPSGTAPSASGDYVLQEVNAKHAGITVSSATGSTISFVAVEGEKEKMKLKNVKLHLGVSPSLNFEWEKMK